MKLSTILYAFVGFVLLGVAPVDRGRAEALNETQTEPKGYIVALGLSDELNVFHSEAMQAAAILARYYARGVAPLVLTNTRTSRVATAETLRDALTESSSRMDRDKDVLFVFLTSHGSQQGVEIKAGKRRSMFQPAQLGGLLRQTNVRKKVLIISACYSGIFTSLADPETLVITAADGRIRRSAAKKPLRGPISDGHSLVRRCPRRTIYEILSRWLALWCWRENARKDTSLPIRKFEAETVS